LVVAFTPALKAVSPFAWFVAAGLGAVIYFALADRTATFDDVSGEPIAVESKH
jgi:NCS1 family nucleobase:cation symporter-1